MKPVDFLTSNLTLTGDLFGHDVEDLPTCRYLDESMGRPLVLSCWRPSWRERISLLFFGRCWFRVFGTTHPPISLFAQRSDPVSLEEAISGDEVDELGNVSSFRALRDERPEHEKLLVTRRGSDSERALIEDLLKAR